MHLRFPLITIFQFEERGRRGRDCMVLGCTITCAISAYHHWCCEFESNPSEVYSMQYYVVKLVSDIATGQWFSPGNPLSSTYKTDRHDMAEILFKVALNTISISPYILRIQIVQNYSSYSVCDVFSFRLYCLITLD